MRPACVESAQDVFAGSYPLIAADRVAVLDRRQARAHDRWSAEGLRVADLGSAAAFDLDYS